MSFPQSPSAAVASRHRRESPPPVTREEIRGRSPMPQRPLPNVPLTTAAVVAAIANTRVGWIITYSYRTKETSECSPGDWTDTRHVVVQPPNAEGTITIAASIGAQRGYVLPHPDAEYRNIEVRKPPSQVPLSTVTLQGAVAPPITPPVSSFANVPLPMNLAPPANVPFPAQGQNEPQPTQSLSAAIERWNLTGMPTTAIFEMSDADFITLGFSVVEKITLKSHARQQIGQLGDQVKAVASGDLETGDLPGDDDQDPESFLYHAENISTHDMPTLWMQKITFANSGRFIPPGTRAEIDFCIKTLRQLRTTALAGGISLIQTPAQTILERLTAIHIRTVCNNPMAAVRSLEAKIAKAREQVRSRLRRSIPYAALVREIIAADSTKNRNFFRRRQGRPAQQSGQNSAPSTPRGQSSTTCRLCGISFTGSWFRNHRPSCTGVSTPRET